MKRLCILIMVATMSGVLAEEPDTKPAVNAAQEWLTAVDAGKYSESWEQAAAYFQGAVTKDAWVSALQGVRKPLGDVKARKAKSVQFHASLPGAPDGEYVIIQFDAAFQHKAAAVETVTAMRDKGDHWRVVGYFIK